MKNVQVIESIEENKTEWVVSLTDNNPKAEDCFVVTDAKEAFRIKKILEAWANDDKYENLEKQVVELLGVTGCGNILDAVEYIKTLQSKQ